MRKPKDNELFTQLTHYSSPDSMINTVDGPLGYSLWCHKEAARISSLPRRFGYVCRDENGKLIALWVNRVAGNNDSSPSDQLFKDLKQSIIGL